VSAVGHEIDFTISDFVADVRAATPSAAAEIITEGVFSSLKFVSEIGRWFQERAQQILQRKQNDFQDFSRRLLRAHPKRRINERLQFLDDLQTSFFRCAQRSFRKQQTASLTLLHRLWRLRPMQLLNQRKELFLLAQNRLLEQAQHHIRRAQNHFSNLETRLRLLSPEQVLARGYSITTDAKSGKVIRDSRKVQPGQKLKTRVAIGEIESIAQVPDNRSGKSTQG
jgi:exodeoxyribonuclease VII large subunit